MIGILTFHFAHNYGATLQAYALSRYLCVNGIETQVINYRPENMSLFYSMTLKGIPLYRIPIKFIRNMRRKDQARLFEKFINEELPCTLAIKKGELSEISNDYSHIIAGSDQIWNVDITQNDTTFFLDFCHPNVKRIGYAISIGNPNNQEILNENIKKYSGSFYKLSMREHSGAQRVQSLNGIMPEVVCDPVFLLNSTDWRKIGRAPNGFTEEDFILYYSLINDSELDEKTMKLAVEYNLEIISVHPICTKANIKCKNLKNVGPQEFVWLIENARFVCSNSFHATAFSCIFEKNALIIPNRKSSDRSQQLLDLVKPMKNNEISDFSKCKISNLQKLIEDSKNYLISCYSDHNEN